MERVKEMTQCDLNTIIQLHEKWLRGEPGGKKADLRSANLRYADLHNADLRYANLHNADLRYADLSYADLRSADLRSADLRGADLSYADLRGADLRGADLRSADLRGADLRGADLRYANVDFSSWPLWCGSLKGVKVDARIARQLAYHLCSVVCDDPEFTSARKQILPFANKFHRVDECGKLKKIR